MTGSRVPPTTLRCSETGGREMGEQSRSRLSVRERERERERELVLSGQHVRRATRLP